ncbi:hypothetical protein HA402_010448 [Bradysia odoriphaga]|nr:hypothetical protein HA402_010448 [Bradysia odoriphaga]
MQKSAIIYRDASAQFIYVCYHCGCSFFESHSILSHIESHFEIINVMVDQVAEDVKEENTEQIEADSFAVIFDHIKVEPFDDINDGGLLASTSIPTYQYDTQITECRTDSKEFIGGKDSRNLETQKIPPPLRPNKQFTCGICGLSFKAKHIFSKHLEIHTNTKSRECEKVHQCNECGKTFTTKGILTNHVLTHNVSIPFIFDHIKVEPFDDINDGGLLASTSVPTYQYDTQITECRTDSKELIGGKDSRNLEMKKIPPPLRPNKQFTCGICGLSFKAKHIFSKHLEIHTNTKSRECEKVHQCNECGKTFTTKGILTNHVLTHNVSIPFIFDHIKVEPFDDINDGGLLASTSVPTYQYDTQITECRTDSKELIGGKDSRNLETKKIPPPLRPNKQFTCGICGLSFKAKHIFSKHLEIHTNTKSHECEKVHQCHECGKTFTTKGILTNHVLTHNFSIPCKICGKVFKPGTYKGHMETHRLDRPFKCQLCPKTFNTKPHLKKHNETHSSRKHPCRYCESEFNTGDALRLHSRRKHKDELQSQKQQ